MEKLEDNCMKQLSRDGEERVEIGIKRTDYIPGILNSDRRVLSSCCWYLHGESHVAGSGA